MRKYEAVFIFRTEEENLTSGKNFVAEQFQKSKINILKQEDMGERALAYPIKKTGRGHYILFDIESDPSALKNMEKTFIIKSEILKFLFVKKEEKLDKKIKTRKRKPAGIKKPVESNSQSGG